MLRKITLIFFDSGLHELIYIKTTDSRPDPLLGSRFVIGRAFEPKNRVHPGLRRGMLFVNALYSGSAKAKM